MKILLVGAGRWGKNHLKVLTKLVDELYVADSDQSQLEACRELSIPTDHLSMDYHDFLDRVDGIDVVTPADSHLAICKDCFDKKKDVFVEKPIALNSSEAKTMIAHAEQKGVILQVGHIYRYHPASTKIREMLRERKLGEVRYAYAHFMGFKRPRSDVGVTQTDAIHYFDLFNYLFSGPPQKVTAVIKNYLNLPLDDTSLSILEYGDKLVFIEAGYLPPEKRRDIAIIGDRGSVYCDFQRNSLVYCENRHETHGGKCVALEGEEQAVSFQTEEPLRLELKLFVDSIKNRNRPLADGHAGFQALKIVEACYESSRRGKRLEIEYT